MADIRGSALNVPSSSQIISYLFPLSDVELFKLCYKVSKKEDNDFDKPLNLIFKNFDFSDIFIATVTECPYDPDCVGKMYICDKNKRTIDDNEYQKIAECMKYIYKMYAKEN